MTIFIKNYAAWRRLCRPLTMTARKKLWNSLHRVQQERLIEDCDAGSWEDLLFVDEIGRRVRNLKRVFGEDYFSIKTQVVVRGHSIRVSKKFWRAVFDALEGFPNEFRRQFFGNIHSYPDPHDRSKLIIGRNRSQFKNTAPSQISIAEVLGLQTFLETNDTFLDFLIFLGLTRDEISKYAKIDLKKME